MTTTVPNSESDAVAVGPPPPFDPELAPALAARTFTVSERAVPGPAGEPDISLAVCMPAKATTPVAAIYFMHGGGMITGSNRGSSIAGAHKVAAGLGLATHRPD